jgi:hypothetical protein
MYEVAGLLAIMKKFASVLILSLAAFASGWAVRGHSGESHVPSDLLKAQMFNNAYAEVTTTEVIIEQLDTARIDDAKHMLRLHQAGQIFTLDSLPESPSMSAKDMAALLDFNNSIQSPSGGMRKMANKILARVAHHRAEHPWTYSGNLPASTDADIEAKLEAILKRASDSQK